MALRARRAGAILLTLLVIVLVFLLRAGNRVVLDLQTDEAITVRGPEDTVCVIPYASIRSLTLLEDFDRGECEDGGSKHKVDYGTWRCEPFGRYTLIAAADIKPCLALTDMSGQVTVFNYESAEVTENLYELIRELLAQHGYILG